MMRRVFSYIITFWSFVGNKKHRRRTWYAVERKGGTIVAWQNGQRDMPKVVGQVGELSNKKL
jgi:IS1 family transposase